MSLTTKELDLLFGSTGHPDKVLGEMFEACKLGPLESFFPKLHYWLKHLVYIHIEFRWRWPRSVYRPNWSPERARALVGKIWVERGNA